VGAFSGALNVNKGASLYFYGVRSWIEGKFVTCRLGNTLMCNVTAELHVIQIDRAISRG
jgi:hypothetical protein